MNKNSGNFLKKLTKKKNEITNTINTPFFRKGQKLEDSSDSDIYSDVSSIKEEEKIIPEKQIIKKDKFLKEKIKAYNKGFMREEKINLIDIDEKLICKNFEKIEKQKIEEEISDSESLTNENEKEIIKYSNNFTLESERKIILKPTFINPKKKNEIKKEENKIQILKEENQILTIKAKRIKKKEEENLIIIDINLPDDNDDKDDILEFEKWKLREIKRLKRDKLEKEKYILQEMETNRRRALDDKERILEDKKIGKYKKNLKSDYKYMQKYYSSFSFYQDKDDPIFKRDYNVPVGFDTFEKSSLPKRLQVRGGEFGKKGRSKYKDLLTEDTNNYDSYYQLDKNITDKYYKKRGGVHK